MLPQSPAAVTCQIHWTYRRRAMLKETTEVTRKTYQKPEISEVDLSMEDVVLGDPSIDSQDPLSIFDF